MLIRGNRNALLGDGLALISAIAYGFYVILLKVKIKNQARISMSLFFGFVGLFNIILVWPFGLLLDYSDIETFQWPSGRDLILGIVINAAITFVSLFFTLFISLADCLSRFLMFSIFEPCS